MEINVFASFNKNDGAEGYPDPLIGLDNGVPKSHHVLRTKSESPSPERPESNLSPAMHLVHHSVNIDPVRLSHV